jgi:transcriptional regulator GlxA family with amidase domain
VLVTFPRSQILDVTGPAEVFAGAARAATGAPYVVEVVAAEAGPVAMSNGLSLLAQRGIDEVVGPVDTLIVAGGDGTAEALADRRLLDWIRRRAGQVRRLASVCSGAFLLAEAGLLDGRRAVTHWAACDRFERRYPAVRLERDPIFVEDRGVYTSAGVCAGMDLALALVEEDLGRDVALAIARRLVIFLQRPGGQSQFSAQLAGQLAERRPLRELQAWVVENPGADLSVERLAERIAMSPRNFARVFAREVGATPARWVEQVRIEAARRRLEESDAGVDEIAARCGFGSTETMRRAFLRAIRVSPADYRSRFRAPRRAAV